MILIDNSLVNNYTHLGITKDFVFPRWKKDEGHEKIFSSIQPTCDTKSESFEELVSS